MNDQEYNGHVIEDLCALGKKIVDQYPEGVTVPKRQTRCSTCGSWRNEKEPRCLNQSCNEHFHQLSPKEVSDGVMRELVASDQGVQGEDE